MLCSLALSGSGERAWCGAPAFPGGSTTPRDTRRYETAEKGFTVMGDDTQVLANQRMILENQKTILAK